MMLVVSLLCHSQARKASPRASGSSSHKKSSWTTNRELARQSISPSTTATTLVRGARPLSLDGADSAPSPGAAKRSTVRTAEDNVRVLRRLALFRRLFGASSRLRSASMAPAVRRGLASVLGTLTRGSVPWSDM